MHKNKIKITLLIGLVCLFSFVILQQKDTKQINSEPQSTRSVSINEMPNKEKPIKKVKSNNKSEVFQGYFSSDPYINQMIILATLSDCIEYLEYSKDHKDDAYIWKSNLVKFKSKEVQAGLKRRLEECQRINDEHPELDLNNRVKIERKSFELESQTLLQQVFKYEKYIGDDEQANQRFIHEIAIADKRVLLTMNAHFVMHDYHSHYSYKIMALLHTQQVVYTWETAMIAQTIYGCNVNGGCDGFSLPLSFECKRDESVCHLNDFNEYIKIAYSPGQQADIALVLTYIENLFADAIEPQEE